MSWETKDTVTACIAVFGAGLSIINTWHALDQRKVRLRVVPKISNLFISGDFGPEMGCIEVVNLSSFPVSVSEIGLTIDGDPRKHRRLAIPDPMTHDQHPFARTLQPRHAITGYFELTHMDPGIRRAYVRTECGEVAYGDGPAITRMRRGTHGQ